MISSKNLTATIFVLLNTFCVPVFAQSTPGDTQPPKCRSQPVLSGTTSQKGQLMSYRVRPSINQQCVYDDPAPIADSIDPSPVASETFDAKTEDTQEFRDTLIYRTFVMADASDFAAYTACEKISNDVLECAGSPVSDEVGFDYAWIANGPLTISPIKDTFANSSAHIQCSPEGGSAVLSLVVTERESGIQRTTSRPVFCGDVLE